MTQPPEIMLQVQRILKKPGFIAEFDGDALRGQEVGDNAQWQWIIRFTSHRGGFVVCVAYVPVKVPAARRAAVAEFMTRANCSLNFGNFEMSWAGGEVIFRTGIPATDSGVSETAIEQLIDAPYRAMDRYMPALLAVALGNADPKKAVEDAERAPSQLPEQGQVSTDASAGPEAPTEPPKSTESEDRQQERRRRLFGNEN
jgi:hypothetical protein